MLREDLLLQAAAEGNFKQVKSFLDTGVDVNATDIRKRTPLMCAVESSNQGRMLVVKELLDRGADVNVTDMENNTALILAADQNPVPRMVETLLDHGAKPNHQNEHKFTALLLAARMGHLPGVKALIAKGAFIDHQDSTLVTPLKIAVYHGKVDVVQELLKHGASINITDYFGKTVLDYAQQRNEKDMQELLLNALSQRAIKVAKAQWQDKRRPAVALQTVHEALAKNPTNTELLALGAEIAPEAAKAEAQLIARVQSLQAELQKTRMMLSRMHADHAGVIMDLQRTATQLAAATPIPTRRSPMMSKKPDYSLEQKVAHSPKPSPKPEKIRRVPSKSDKKKKRKKKKNREKKRKSTESIRTPRR